VRAIPSLILAALVALPLQSGTGAGTISWTDVAPAHGQLERLGISKSTFDGRLRTIRQANARRVHEGDLDHLIFYVLQSTRFTGLQPIEPALSAKRHADTGEIPEAVRTRIAAFLEAVDSGRGGDARLSYFRDLARDTFPDPAGREAGLLREYARVAKFIYEKEFVAQRAGDAARRDAAIAELYRTRGLSTDTAVEAGFVVYEALAVSHALDPNLRIRRVLIVGPGLDLAPRTGLLEASAPQSYQPWAVIDALLSLGLARASDLTVVGADINPRVVDHLRGARGRARTLTFVTGIADKDPVRLSEGYREYFERLGSHLVSPRGGGPPPPVAENQGDRLRRGLAEARVSRSRAQAEAPRALSNADRTAGHLSKAIRVDAAISRVLDARHLDIVTERLSAEPFDLVIATNILPYFDDVELLLALTNVSAMLEPGGLFLHNEPRPILGDFTDALGLRLEQSRHAVIANVTGAPPLGDSVFLHRKLQSPVR
jgi:hypothetical protein